MKHIFIAVIIVLVLTGCYNTDANDSSIKMVDLTTMSLDDIKIYAKQNNIQLKIIEEYNDSITKDYLISQSIAPNTVIKNNDILNIIISLGPIPISLYQENKINELGNVPIMMYHSIVNRANDETIYTGGNVDKNGYNRTKEAFINDLKMYYENNYRMIRLIDYMNGNVNVEFGKSPIILTFDDGSRDNINILGKDESGKLIIDPNSAVGILEDFKNKHPDFNVTATFFLNSGLFGQPKYNDEILKWLVDNGYDIGNHTKNHVDFKSVDVNKAQEEVAYMYKLFDGIIKDKYIHVVALPFGSPDKKSHANFPYILEGNDNGYNYKTDGTLRVGWDANYSPFHVNFDKTFMKRIRAWDNNGKEFDIKMVFDVLKNTRYISDGNPRTIVISDDKYINDNIKDKKIVKY